MSKTTKLLNVLDFTRKNGVSEIVDIKSENDEIKLIINSGIFVLNNIDVPSFPWDSSEVVLPSGCDYITFIFGSMTCKNKLESFVGIPNNVSAEVIINDMQKIKDLRGFPQHCLNVYINDCYHLKSFYGCPKYVRDMGMTEVDIEEFDYFPEVVEHAVTFRDMPLKNLKNINCNPSFLNLTHIYDIDLSYVPKVKEGIVFDDCTFTNIDGITDDTAPMISYGSKHFNPSKFKKYVIERGLVNEIW